MDEKNMNPLGFRCECHLKHAEKIDKAEKFIDKHSETHNRLQDAIEKRVTNKFFFLLVTLVVGMLGFQWVNYEKLSEMDKNVTAKIAVIEVKLNSHILYVNPSVTNQYDKPELKPFKSNEP